MYSTKVDSIYSIYLSSKTKDMKNSHNLLDLFYIEKTLWALQFRRTQISNLLNNNLCLNTIQIKPKLAKYGQYLQFYVAITPKLCFSRNANDQKTPKRLYLDKDSTKYIHFQFEAPHCNYLPRNFIFILNQIC